MAKRTSKLSVRTAKEVSRPTKHRSSFEDTIISGLERDGINYLYEPEKISYNIERKYTPDLLINDIYIELKGFLRSDDQRKMKAVKKLHPELDLRFVFQNAYSTIQGARARADGSKMSCAEWANMTGFVWAHQKIPIEWTT